MLLINFDLYYILKISIGQNITQLFEIIFITQNIPSMKNSCYTNRLGPQRPRFWYNKHNGE